MRASCNIGVITTDLLCGRILWKVFVSIINSFTNLKLWLYLPIYINNQIKLPGRKGVSYLKKSNINEPEYLLIKCVGIVDPMGITKISAVFRKNVDSIRAINSNHSIINMCFKYQRVSIIPITNSDCSQ